MDDQGKLRNRVVAFTSATPGEGVTHVVNTVAKELAAQTQNRVLQVEAAGLRDLCLTDRSQVSSYCEETEIDNLLKLSREAAASKVAVIEGSPRATKWDSAPEYRVDCLKALRWNFDYVLIDCSSAAVSADATTLAPVVDGVVVVVKAAETRRAEIQRCQQTIESAGGNFLGFVLNQREYPVPNWIYRIL